jgi:hypothetical protein
LLENWQHDSFATNLNGVAEEASQIHENNTVFCQTLSRKIAMSSFFALLLVYWLITLLICPAFGDFWREFRQPMDLFHQQDCIRNIFFWGGNAASTSRKNQLDRTI